MSIINHIQGIYSTDAWEPPSTKSPHVGSLQYSVNYHLIALRSVNQMWGHTAIGQDKCCLYGNHPTMTRAPFEVGGSPPNYLINRTMHYHLYRPSQYNSRNLDLYLISNAHWGYYGHPTNANVGYSPVAGLFFVEICVDEPLVFIGS